MPSTPPQNVTKAPSPMRLVGDQMGRLYKLTLEVSRALGRDVTPLAILRILIGDGLTYAEQDRGFAGKVRDGNFPPWKQRERRRARASRARRRASSSNQLEGGRTP